jgi:hypothetical protein
VSFEEMQFIAPGDPFRCNPEPVEAPGTFTSVLSCSAVVHRDYDKKGSNWVAALSMGQLDDRLLGSGDLTHIASQTLTALLPYDYAEAKPKVKREKVQNLTGLAPNGRGVLLSAEVHVSKKGVASTYDRVVLVVVKLRSGRHVAWYAERPNDSPKDVMQALQDSADTLTAR